MKTGRWILLFSQKFADTEERFGFPTVLRAINNDGVEVRFTCQLDTSDPVRWRARYKWPDAVVVGYIDSYDQIVENLAAQLRRPIQTRNVVNPQTA